MKKVPFENLVIGNQYYTECGIWKGVTTYVGTVILENMDITEKTMYLDYLKESKQTKKEESEKIETLEEILKREGLTIDELQDYN